MVKVCDDFFSEPSCVISDFSESVFNKVRKVKRKRRKCNKVSISSDDCLSNNDCVMACDTKVDVDLEANPTVTCKRTCSRSSNFDIALDIETRPRCSISHKSSTRVSDCKERCVFTVNVDCDYTCKPTILNKCSFPKATFDLAIETKTKQKIRPRRC